VGSEQHASEGSEARPEPVDGGVAHRPAAKLSGLGGLSAMSKFLDNYDTHGPAAKLSGLGGLSAMSKFLDNYDTHGPAAKLSGLGGDMAALVNAQLAAAGVFPRITPSRFGAVAAAMQEVGQSSAGARRTQGPLDEGERASARALAQVLTTVLVCLYLAQLSLSANEVVKVVLQMVGAMSLAGPGVNVPKLTGLVFDYVWPPGTDDEA
jgi:hypothetical protein